MQGLATLVHCFYLRFYGFCLKQEKKVTSRAEELQSV